MDRVQEAIATIKKQQQRKVIKARMEGFWAGSFITTFVIIAIWSIGRILEQM